MCQITVVLSMFTEHDGEVLVILHKIPLKRVSWCQMVLSH